MKLCLLQQYLSDVHGTLAIYHSETGASFSYPDIYW